MPAENEIPDALGLGGRVAWVTGASGALGAAIARALAAAGAEVFASARQPASLDGLTASPAAPPHGRITAVPTDVTDAAAVGTAVATIVEAAGRLDILVNSTALPIFGPFAELDDAQWLAVLDAKLLGYMRTMRAALPVMASQGYGRIVNIGGRGGRQPSAVHLPGACANAAVNVLSKGLADAYAARNIRINVVAPGPIRSERLERLRDADGRGDAPETPGQLRLATPIPRQGRPADIADAVLYLVSDRADYVTGIVLQVDGGGTAAL